MFCRNCGYENNEGAIFCKKCGYNFKSGSKVPENIREHKKSKLSNKKVIIPILLILLVAIGVSGYFLYQNDRMQQMDKYMSDYNYQASQFKSKYDETLQIADSSPINYDAALISFTESVDIQKTKMENLEKAYQYSDGAYKDLIAIKIKAERLRLDAMGYSEQLLESAKSNDLTSVQAFSSKVNSLTDEMNKVESDYSTFLSTHPDVKQHVNQYWGTNN